MIASPDGRKRLPGKCKLCGAVRKDFNASTDDAFSYRQPRAQ